MRPRSVASIKRERPSSPENLFTQVILAAKPEILKIWETGDHFIKKDGLNCDQEISFRKDVGRSYYRCQPHFWQCYWERGVTQTPAIKIDLFDQTFHVEAKPVFNPIPAYSPNPRYYEIIKSPDFNLHFGVQIELGVREIPGLSWPVILTDSCRDVFLPERIYPYGKRDSKAAGEGFIWDNFDRKIFIDKFYVSQQQVNEWYLETGHPEKIPKDRRLWPNPAILNREDQVKYCASLGKRVLEAKIFDAATMTPSDLKNPLPDRVMRPQTPWQRDLSKSFLGMARINPDYQLTPLDCQLAQVEGCPERIFSTDSATWMGINYAIGFYPEHLHNDIDPGLNLKPSSRLLPAMSEWHELGLRSSWNGLQEGEHAAVAFRCYEEVSQ